MGYGDWLMAAGEARLAHEKTGRPVLITDPVGTPQWSEVFEGNPYILRKPFAAGGFVRVISSSGNRPYIAAKSAGRWTWKPYTPIPAEMFFTDAELAFAEPYRGAVMLEPNVKAIGHSNKAWPAERWRELIQCLGGPLANDMHLVACTPHNPERLAGASLTVAVTPTFRQALAVLSVCRALVTTEGGLMHGAAAVGTPAVVLWSEFIDPSITGYKQHRNIRHAHRTCGMRIPCPSCRKSMEAITVREVVDALAEVIGDQACVNNNASAADLAARASASVLK